MGENAAGHVEITFYTAGGMEFVRYGWGMQGISRG